MRARHLVKVSEIPTRGCILSDTLSILKLSARKEVRGEEGRGRLVGNVSPTALERCSGAVGEVLQLCCSIATGLLEKVYGGFRKPPKPKNRARPAAARFCYDVAAVSASEPA